MLTLTVLVASIATLILTLIPIVTLITTLTLTVLLASITMRANSWGLGYGQM